MSWVTPTTRSTGYVVTAAEWNKNTVDNPAQIASGLKTAEASGGLTLTSSFQDIPGASVTLDEPGDWLITATVLGSAHSDDSGGNIEVALHDGSAQSLFWMEVLATGANYQFTRCSSLPLTGVSASTDIKLQAKKTGSGGSSSIDASGTPALTRLQARWVGP